MIGLQGMLSDEGHSESLFRKIARLVLPILGLAVAENLLAYLFDKRLRRNETLERNNGWLYAALFTVILAVVCLLRIQSAGPSRFWYILLAMFLLFPVFLKDVNAEAYQTEIYLFIIPAIVAMLAIVLATNQGIAIVSYGCVWGLMGLVLILRKVSSEYRQIDTFVIGAMCFMFLFFCPDKAGGSTNIFWQRELITEGSAKGLYAQESTVEEYCSVCDVVEKYANSDEKLLVISDYTANAYTNTLAIEATFSPDYVSPWSERYNYFYELYPSQMPSVIILDENYIGNVEEYLANSPLGEMIHSNYDYENYIRDGRYGIIYEKCN
jgi:hypothetical protein